MKGYSRKEIIVFSAIIVISVLVGIGSNYLGGIITFFVLGLFFAIGRTQIHAQKTKPVARELLRQKHPSSADLDKCIADLRGSETGDEESKELIRRLMAKRDELEINNQG